jgi:hypothetical protein
MKRNTAEVGGGRKTIVIVAVVRDGLVRLNDDDNDHDNDNGKNPNSMGWL